MASKLDYAATVREYAGETDSETSVDQSLTAEISGDLTALEEIAANTLKCLQSMHDRVFGIAPPMAVGIGSNATIPASPAFAETYRRRIRALRSVSNRIEHLSSKLNADI